MERLSKPEPGASEEEVIRYLTQSCSDVTIHDPRNGFFNHFIDQIDEQISSDFMSKFGKLKTDEDRVVYLWSVKYIIHLPPPPLPSLSPSPSSPPPLLPSYFPLLSPSPTPPIPLPHLPSPPPPLPFSLPPTSPVSPPLPLRLSPSPPLFPSPLPPPPSPLPPSPHTTQITSNH
ncbi:hypothetical protein C7M84_015534 [Penaeus vannamei]|uniref:Uncharacterized protein n=1 Tax=Penaeus vannamei TaxID=6689 RepID=A0A3R7QG87_PENVA|nr:hypothetical protein C7M84_015534 [Penaeus vannamei]